MKHFETFLNRFSIKDKHGHKDKWMTITRRLSKTAVKSCETNGTTNEDVEDIIKWMCAYCGFEDKSINGLKTHLSNPSIHDEDDLFESSKLLKDQTTGQKNYKCIVCFSRAVKVVALKRHIKTHTKGETPYCSDISYYTIPV